MRLTKKSLNLQIFGEASAGAESGAEVEGEMGENSTNTSGGAQPEGSNENGSDSVKDAIEKTEKERRQEYINYIRGEGKQFHDEEVQSVINKRFKETKKLEKAQAKLTPLLKAIAEDFDLENADDIDTVIDAYINNEDRLMNRAASNGLTVEQQKQFDMMANENASLKQTQAQLNKEAKQNEILERWQKEEQNIKIKIDPDFNLDKAFENELFSKAVIEHQLPLEWAYDIAFKEQVQAKIRSEAEQKVMNNIKARGQRPTESVAQQQNGTANQSININNMSDEQIFELARRAKRGEEIDLKTRF